jgi:hypothetical protein
LRQAPLPSQVPSFPQLAAPAPMHCEGGVGTCPAGTFVQVPGLPVTVHDLQVPVQAELQQTPCTQYPELHSAFIEQVEPSDFFPQLPFMQALGETQSVFVAQVLPHAVADPHLNGSHAEAVPALHRPAPSQVPADVSVDPVQDGGVHCVPAVYCSQAPAPLHLPSAPQVDAFAIGHWEAATGAAPAGIAVQVPTVPVRAHDTQVAAHPVLQQRPCSQ